MSEDEVLLDEERSEDDSLDERCSEEDPFWLEEVSEDE